MPLAPVLRGQLIRAQADTVLNCKEPTKSIRILGADAEILKLIKEYAYEGKITGLSKENVDRVLNVADMYNLIGILNECKLFIKNTNIPEH